MKDKSFTPLASTCAKAHRWEQTMNYRFYNARILTMNQNEPLFFGEVWVCKERIEYVGPSGTDSEIQRVKPTWEEEIDCNGNLLMPGFKNAHTHSAMTLLRSYADDLPLQEWLNQQVFPIEAKLTEDDIFWLTKLAVLEYLTSGITAIFDMYLDPYAVAEACSSMGMRCVQTGGVNNFSQSVSMVEDCMKRLNGRDSLISYVPGFHAEYTCSRDLLEQLADMAKRLKSPMYTHLSETKREVLECQNRYQMPPGAFLASLGIFDYGGGVFHGVHLTEDEMDLFAEKKVSVVTNPGSNTKLASGIAPISSFLQKGLTVAIGTDGPASNNCLDMFREMFLVTGLAKLRDQDAKAVDAMEVLKMAAVNGARVMQLQDCDVLSEGKLADLILLDLNQPNMQPLNHIAKNIVYSGSKQNVKITMIHGCIRYRDGQFLTGHAAEEIYEKANAIIGRLRT